ncbi:MAG TPA: ABC transporter permease [Gemmatimonadaceae bacterium]|jgi:predicted permease
MKRAIRRVLRIERGGDSLADEVADEIRFHVLTRTEALIAGGVEPAEAYRRALEQFGDVDALSRECITLDEERTAMTRRANYLDELRQDVAYGLRVFSRKPAFAAVVILTLALGLGANTAIFTLIDAVLLRALPVSHPEQLVLLGNPARPGGRDGNLTRVQLFSKPLYEDLRNNNRVLSGLAATGRTDRLDAAIDRVATGDETEHPSGRLVSGNYFTVLGVAAERGRALTSADDGDAGASPIVVISHDYWIRRFEGRADAIGRAIRLNGVSFTIVGVAQAGFTGEIVGQPTDVWIPLCMQPSINAGLSVLDDRATSFLLLFGRLRPGVTLDVATGALTALTRRELLSANYASGATFIKADDAKRMTIPIGSGARGVGSLREDYRTPLMMLMAGVALLLVIVCGNVANLLLARAVARDREMSVRLALGAGPARIVRQLLVESGLLALSGCALGLIIATFASRALLVISTGGGTAVPLGIDLRVLIFTALAALAALTLFGLAPALRASRLDLASALRSGARAIGRGGQSRIKKIPLSGALVASQVALSFLLMVSAGLLVRGVRNIEQRDLGMDRDRLAVVDVQPDARRYTGEAWTRLGQRVLGDVGAIPGVAHVSLSINGLLSGTEGDENIGVDGFTSRVAADSVVQYDEIGPNYFRTLGATLIAGREFGRDDEKPAPRAAIVNETLARFYFGGPSAALGKTFRFGRAERLAIVGVVADVRDHGLTAPSVRRLYTPYFNPADRLDFMRVEVRATEDPAGLSRPIRVALHNIDPSLRVLSIRPLNAAIEASLNAERLLMRLALVFGGIAIALSAIGLYGVMGYTVARRTSEMGLRAALGASRMKIGALVIGEAFAMASVGMIAGTPLAIAASIALRGRVHGLTGFDPISIAVAIVVLVLATAAAVVVPTVRAIRVDPVVALRADA